MLLQDDETRRSYVAEVLEQRGGAGPPGDLAPRPAAAVRDSYIADVVRCSMRSARILSGWVSTSSSVKRITV